MNTVNLIGKIATPPKFIEKQGRKVAQLIVKTREPYLDTNGDQQFLQNSHTLIAWGKWFSILQKIAEPGLEVCIQGSLRTNFYQDQLGRKHCRTEIEIHDFLLL